MSRNIVVAFSLVAATLLGSGIAKAQDANPFVGQWTVKWDGKKRSEVAELEITATGGKFRNTSGNSRYDPCLGLEAPVEIKKADAQDMAITARYSDVMQGCKDVNMKLQRGEDGKVTGQRGEFELRLDRK